MAKRNNSKALGVKLDANEENRIYVQSKKIWIDLSPIPYHKIQLIQQSIEKKMRAEGWQVDIPTYETVVDIDGVKETQVHNHDESTIETEDEKALWANYKSAQNEMAGRNATAALRILLRDGVDVDPMTDPSWMRRQEKDGIDIPEDDDDLKLHYIMTEILQTPQEQKNAAAQVMYLSTEGMDEEARNAVKNLFRNPQG